MTVATRCRARPAMRSTNQHRVILVRQGHTEKRARSLGPNAQMELHALLAGNERDLENGAFEPISKTNSWPLTKARLNTVAASITERSK